MACKICDSPALPDGTRPADVVARLLKQKIPYKKIQAATGFDKSLICRHGQKCLIRESAGQIKDSYFKQGDSMFILWPGQSVTRPMGPHDWIVRVQYGKGVGDPCRMLTAEEVARLQESLKTPEEVKAVETESQEDQTTTPTKSASPCYTVAPL